MMFLCFLFSKNYSDELGCPSMGPNQCNQEKHFRCKSSGICIPISWHCDGSNDCDDHSDEEECGTISCPTNFYKCNNSNCVFKAYICDQKDDCGKTKVFIISYFL